MIFKEIIDVLKRKYADLCRDYVEGKRRSSPHKFSAFSFTYAGSSAIAFNRA